MPTIEFKLESPTKFSKKERETFVRLLKQQGKVSKPTMAKVDRCKLLGICKADGFVVSIGAIKPRTNSDFNNNKAALEMLRDEFQSELGYFFTLPGHTGKGYSSRLALLLIDSIKNENLMASTELNIENPMRRILEKNGFRQLGKPWKSGIHQGILGLFLRFTKN